VWRIPHPSKNFSAGSWANGQEIPTASPGQRARTGRGSARCNGCPHLVHQDMSTNVILTSDFPSNPPTSVVARIRAVAQNPRVAWIAPASVLRRVRYVAAQHAFRSLGLANLEYVDLAPSSTAQRRLASDFDVVYLSGGDPVLFRANLAESGLGSRIVDFVADGGLVVAASGGAMQLTQNLSVYRLLSSDVDHVVAARHAYDGLALVGVEFLPHLNRHTEAFMVKVRKYSEAVPHDIVALEDGGALWWNAEGGVSCAGHGARVCRGVVSPMEAAA